jgi:hypothetical protein
MTKKRLSWMTLICAIFGFAFSVHAGDFSERQRPIKVDVTQYLPTQAVSVTMLVAVYPPTGTAVIYTKGNEGSPVVFKGPVWIDEIRLHGPYIYVKLIGAKDFRIRYLNYHIPGF